MAESKLWVIVRELPGIGSSTQEQLAGASEKSNKAIAQVPGVKWLHSYVVADKTYCVYQAPDKESIEQHAEISGFPANAVEEVKTKISPATADPPPH